MRINSYFVRIIFYPNRRKTNNRAKKCLKKRKYNIFKLVYFTKLLILNDLAAISLFNIRKTAHLDADKEP